jgi:hypothetical protein
MGYNAAQADVHVVNTCTVTHMAGRKARHASDRGSRHPDSSAAHLSRRVADPEKQQKMKASSSLPAQTMLGTTCQVLWETSRSITGVQIWSGLTGNYVRLATTSTEPLHNCITPMMLERQTREVVWKRITKLPFRSRVVSHLCAQGQEPAQCSPLE